MDMKQTAQKLVEDLCWISTPTGEYILSPRPAEWGKRYTNHYRAKHLHLDDERFGGYLARKQTHIHKLAMILAAAESDKLLITAEHLALANQMVTDLEPDMQFVFSKSESPKKLSMPKGLSGISPNAAGALMPKLIATCIQTFQRSQISRDYYRCGAEAVTSCSNLKVRKCGFGSARQWRRNKRLNEIVGDYISQTTDNFILRFFQFLPNFGSGIISPSLTSVCPQSCTAFRRSELSTSSS